MSDTHVSITRRRDPCKKPIAFPFCSVLRPVGHVGKTGVASVSGGRHRGSAGVPKICFRFVPSSIPTKQTVLSFKRLNETFSAYLAYSFCNSIGFHSYTTLFFGRLHAHIFVRYPSTARYPSGRISPLKRQRISATISMTGAFWDAIRAYFLPVACRAPGWNKSTVGDGEPYCCEKRRA